VILTFSISMIILGSFLEIYYYAFRFHSDGITLWLSIIIGIALTLMLALAVYKRRHTWAWFIIVPVAAYSIMATSAGQAFSLGEVLRTESQAAVEQEYIADEIDDVTSRISWIDSEISRLQEQIDGTVDTLQDRAVWRTTLAVAEERQDELRDERLEHARRLTELRSQRTVHESVRRRGRNIYEFYGELLSMSEDWLQFILQTTLSAFIAAMAPIGILTLPQQGKKRRRHKKPATTTGVRQEDVERWVRVNWIGKRTGKSQKILPVKTFNQFMHDRGVSFTQQTYNQIHGKALLSGVIRNDGAILEDDEKIAVHRILSVDN